MNRAAKIALWGAATLTVVSLVALAVPSIVPLLPHRVQVAIGGTIHTVAGTVEELIAETESGDGPVTHEDVDEEYVTAASIWPWDLPPGWGFPRNRGVADTPGHHYDGMGVRAAFSLWATASLDAVEAGDLDPDAANHLLDEVEDATQTLLDARLLSNRAFIAESITPLRP